MGLACRAEAKNWIAAGRAPRTWPWRRRGDGRVTAQVGDDGPRGPRDARGTYREQQREEVQRHSETSYRARLSNNRNSAVDMRSGNGYRHRAGNMRSGSRNKNKAGNVKATGKEQDSGHFTNDWGAEIAPKERGTKRARLGPLHERLGR